jgi:hypothetical protein
MEGGGTIKIRHSLSTLFDTAYVFGLFDTAAYVFGNTSLAIRLGQYVLGNTSLAIRLLQYVFGNTSLAIRLWQYVFGNTSLAIRLWQVSLTRLHTVITVTLGVSARCVAERLLILLLLCLFLLS